jgi:hypothetical protein
MNLDIQVEAGTKFSNFLLNKINFDTVLNFNQVDLPYPVWNRVNPQHVIFSLQNVIFETGNGPWI